MKYHLKLQYKTHHNTNLKQIINMERRKYKSKGNIKEPL